MSTTKTTLTGTGCQTDTLTCSLSEMGGARVNSQDRSSKELQWGERRALLQWIERRTPCQAADSGDGAGGDGTSHRAFEDESEPLDRLATRCQG